MSRQAARPLDTSLPAGNCVKRNCPTFRDARDPGPVPALLTRDAQKLSHSSRWSGLSPRRKGMKKKALVVGALGVVGRGLLEFLREQEDWETVALSRRTIDDE